MNGTPLVHTMLAEGIRDARVLRAFREVDRAHFVPAEWRPRANEDRPIPISHAQVTTQPSLVARMVEALGLTGDERVLEVGTGYGFQTAILAALAEAVWSIERWPDLAEAARRNLASAGVRGAHVTVGDGTEGLPEHAPYDGVIVSAAHPRVPPPLAEQVAEGGRLVMPIGPGGMEEVILFERLRRRLVERRMLTGAHFVRLIGRHGADREP